MSDHIEALLKLRSGGLHWRAITRSRSYRDDLHGMGYIHRSQAGEYYLTPLGLDVLEKAGLTPRVPGDH